MLETTGEPLTARAVRRLCGELSDAAVAQLLASGATVEDLQRVVAAADRELVRPEGGVADLLTRVLREERGWEERRD